MAYVVVTLNAVRERRPGLFEAVYRIVESLECETARMEGNDGDED